MKVLVACEYSRIAEAMAEQRGNLYEVPERSN